MASITVVVTDDAGNVTSTTLVGTLDAPATIDEIRIRGAVSTDGTFTYIAGEAVDVELDYTDPEGLALNTVDVTPDVGAVGPVTDSGATVSFTWTAP